MMNQRKTPLLVNHLMSAHISRDTVCVIVIVVAVVVVLAAATEKLTYPQANSEFDFIPNTCSCVEV